MHPRSMPARRGRRPRAGRELRPIAALCCSALTLAAPPALAQHQDDPRGSRCVLRLPGMESVQVLANVPFRQVSGRTLAFDLYTPVPKEPMDRTRLPAVVFVNGVGDRDIALKEWGIYQDWARLVAVSGIAAVLHNATAERAGDDLAALFDHLRAHARDLGIDPENLALWACSANVRTGFAYALDPAHDFLQCAVFFYGRVDPALQRHDLPLMLVRAGLDTPWINQTLEVYAQQAVRANLPLTLVNVPNAGHAFDLFEDNDQSREVVKRTLSFLADNLTAGVQAARRAHLDRVRAFGLRAAQDWGAAAAAFAKWGQEEPQAGLPQQLYAEACYQLKQYAQAADAYQRAGDLGANPSLTWYNAACCRALLGEKERALALLEQAVGTGFITDRAALRRDPDLASLVGEPRFERLTGPPPPTP